MRDNAVVVRLPARVRSESGAELVEFALVLPLLLLVFGGIVDFGLLLQRQQVVTNAAREGARLAVLPGYTSADVQARVTQFVQEGINSDTAAPVANLTLVTLTPGAGPGFQAAQVVGHAGRSVPDSRTDRVAGRRQRFVRHDCPDGDLYDACRNRGLGELIA